jgi:hypothetical protein
VQRRVRPHWRQAEVARHLSEIQLKYFITRSVEGSGGGPPKMPIEAVGSGTWVCGAAQEEPVVPEKSKVLHDEAEELTPNPATFVGR